MQKRNRGARATAPSYAPVKHAVAGHERCKARRRASALSEADRALLRALYARFVAPRVPLVQVYRQACYGIWNFGTPQAAHGAPASKQRHDPGRPDTQQLPTYAQFRYLVRKDHALRGQNVVRVKGQARTPSTDATGLRAPAVEGRFAGLLRALRDFNALPHGRVIGQTGLGKTGFVDAALRAYPSHRGPETGRGEGAIYNGPPPFGGGGEAKEGGDPK